MDDDEDIREAITFLLVAEGIMVRPYEDAGGLLERLTPKHTGCLILDVRLPDMDGLTLQRELRQRGIDLPVIFITGHGDIPMAVRAVNDGALDFLEKPFRDDALLEAVEQALEVEAAHREDQQRRAEIEQRLAQLTPRERQVLEGLLDGKPNKLIARDLDVSVRTVEIHRGNLMQKMQARSASHLARLALVCDAYRERLPNE
ncbi:two component transcriptional regulator, LuxR family [Alkalilimnicola ehrlichii MLHE-1]|uniref:Two component transcriptional regulator, LuxR family n=1 Tax=Alkalilimnicola ehrlichii (strain ATCC BAA-1101 / DSM 17681 / MLHE-1) TaxID=187272 RepID=Q0A870_ALKEH|nr:two component transcriptional regulator, LuxR family [Alkalilimnicola ehrlichii MLHE-1]